MKRLVFCIALLGWATALVTLAHGGEKTSLANVIAECAACHGVDGIAKDVEIPNLAGQHDRYIYTQLQHFKSGKRPHKEMRYESRHLTDEEMVEIARYYSTLSP